MYSIITGRHASWLIAYGQQQMTDSDQQFTYMCYHRQNLAVYISEASVDLIKYLLKSMQFQPHHHAEYKFVTALDHNKVLDVAGNNMVCLYDWHKGANQRFRIAHVGNGKYAITNVQHNSAVGIPNNSNDNGCQLESFQSHKHNGELWEFIPVNTPEFFGKPAFYLRSHCGKALDVNEGKAHNEQKIIQWDYNGNKNQIWLVEPITFVPQQNVAYHLASGMDQHMVADISGNPDDHKKLILYKNNGGDNQKFHIHHHNGKYILVNLAHNEALQVHGGSNDNGAKLHVHHRNNHAHEQFDLVPCNHPQHGHENAFYIKTHNNKALDVSGGNAKNEAEIIQWDFHGESNQIWYVQKA